MSWRRLSGIQLGVEQGAVLLLALALGQGGLPRGSAAAPSLALPWAMPKKTGIWICAPPPGRGSSAPVQIAAPRPDGSSGSSGGEIVGGHPGRAGFGAGASRCRRRATLAQQTVGDADAEAIVDLAKVLRVDQQQAGLPGAEMAAGLQEVGGRQTGQLS